MPSTKWPFNNATKTTNSVCLPYISVSFQMIVRTRIFLIDKTKKKKRILAPACVFAIDKTKQNHAVYGDRKTNVLAT